MKKNIILRDVLQIILSDETIEKALEKGINTIKTRKLSYKDLIHYLVLIALEKSNSYREATKVLWAKYKLPKVDYSELSKRASELSFEVLKELFEYVVSICYKNNRKQVNKLLGINKKIVAVDSTIITKSKTKLKWAGFKGQKSGVKLHVKYDIEESTPSKVKESLAKNHDSTLADELKDGNCVLVEDRGYEKISRFDDYMSEEDKQLFVIRIKESTTLVQARKLKNLQSEDSNIIDDVTCQLGNKQKRSKNRFRVVSFTDYNNKKVIVCTNIMNVSSGVIAEIYKMRWEIECFFRFIKQNLNLSNIFGTTKNAVFNQLYASLIAYIIINYLFKQTSQSYNRKNFSRLDMIRALIINEFEVEVNICLINIINRLKIKIFNLEKYS